MGNDTASDLFMLYTNKSNIIVFWKYNKSILIQLWIFCVFNKLFWKKLNLRKNSSYFNVKLPQNLK